MALVGYRLRGVGSNLDLSGLNRAEAGSNNLGLRIKLLGDKRFWDDTIRQGV